jgi:hypothetical protein
MKTTIKVEMEVELVNLKVSANVRYWEDGELDGESDERGLMPCRQGENWCPEINIETGQILNWEKGKTASIHYKVCDCCAWELIDNTGKSVLSGDGYVPGTLSPKEPGYGDYIIMDINSDGFIKDWEFVIDEFTELD